MYCVAYSFTFSKVQDNSEKVWRFYRFGLVEEYYHKPALAPPLIVISHLIMLVQFIYRSCKKQAPVNTDFSEYLLHANYPVAWRWERGFSPLFKTLGARAANIGLLNKTLVLFNYIIQYG